MPGIQDIDMSGDHELLRQIIDEHDIAVKWLAMKVGLHQSSVYRYMEDHGPFIPSIIWRVIYEKTRDVRILQLITGDIPVTVVDLIGDEQTIFEKLDAPSLKQLVHHRRQQIACEESLLEILADGRINKKDAAAISKYKRSHPKMIQTAVRLYQAVMAEYERNRK